MSNLISKLRSTRYDTIIEVKVPTRFYWASDGFDGIEFGPLDKCSKYQVKLLNGILEQMAYSSECTRLIEYMKEHKIDQLNEIIKEAEAHKLGIPKLFIDAFEE